MSMHETTDKRFFFDSVAPRWLRDAAPRSEQLRQILSSYAIPCAAPLLDVGSGAGIMLPFLRERSTSTDVIVEMDISGEMLNLAKHHHGDAGLLRYVQADAHRLPFPAASFNTVMCFSVYPHFHSPALALSELARCLKPGGQLCILHLMGHLELDAMHREAGDAVSRDILPAASDLATGLADYGFHPEIVEERSDLYLIVAALINGE